MSTVYRIAAESEESGSLDRPLRWFREQLIEILSAALCETGATKGLICWPGLGEIHARARRPQGVILPLHQLSANTETETNLYVQSRCTPRAVYKHTLGPMILIFDDLADAPVERQQLNSLVREAELVIGRYQVYCSAARHLEVDIASIVLGKAETLRTLEGATAKIAQSDLPVLFQAEFGSDVIAVAAAAHCLSARMPFPFVALACASQQPDAFRRSLYTAIEGAAGGTLFLSDVEMLNSAMQKDLLSVLTADAGIPGIVGRNVRLFTATTRSLDQLVRDGCFCRLLRAHLEMLKIEVPPLRARQADIRPLVEHEIGERLHSAKWLSEEAMAACEKYRWPGNLSELRQVISRLVVMSDSNCIAMEDLAMHASFILTETTWEDSSALAPNESEKPIEPISVPDLDEEMAQGMQAITELARSLATGTHANLEQYGLGVQRALLYVSQRYETDISLTELAQNAYLSASHLSFLFKKKLGVPFKALLAVVRIEKAKQLLAESRDLSVTEVSLNAGFGDLSHFERTFKRIVGVNPREYRRQRSTIRLASGRMIEGRDHRIGERASHAGLRASSSNKSGK